MTAIKKLKEELPTVKLASEWLWQRWLAKEPLNVFRKVDLEVIYALADAKSDLMKRFPTADEKLDFSEFAFSCGVRSSEEHENKRRSSA
jgi:hypothetical protein